jgi:hypothetical protein
MKGKITLILKYGLFKWLVMLFSLTITHNSLMRLMNHILFAFISSFVIDYFDDIHNKNLGEHIENLWFLFNMSQKKLLCANILNWRNYSQFTIVYGLTLLDLIYLLVDERVRLDGNRKARVMKALFKKVRQHVHEKNEKYAFQSNKRQKRVVFEPRDWVWVHICKERLLDIENQN